jgi:hypothetical protein
MLQNLSCEWLMIGQKFSATTCMTVDFSYAADFDSSLKILQKSGGEPWQFCISIMNI